MASFLNLISRWKAPHLQEESRGMKLAYSSLSLMDWLNWLSSTQSGSPSCCSLTRSCHIRSLYSFDVFIPCWPAPLQCHYANTSLFGKARLCNSVHWKCPLGDLPESYYATCMWRQWAFKFFIMYTAAHWSLITRSVLCPPLAIQEALCWPTFYGRIMLV